MIGGMRAFLLSILLRPGIGAEGVFGTQQVVHDD